jgi:hypothetical protein
MVKWREVGGRKREGGEDGDGCADVEVPCADGKGRARAEDGMG